jgi:hypothetical protein
MNRHVQRRVKFALFATVAVVVLGLVVMTLWNWLTPPLFGWHTLRFPQALGLLLLCRILFGGFGRRPGPHGHWRGRLAERWEQMTPEERDKFREGMRHRCGRNGPEEQAKG